MLLKRLLLPSPFAGCQTCASPRRWPPVGSAGISIVAQPALVLKQPLIQPCSRACTASTHSSTTTTLRHIINKRRATFEKLTVLRRAFDGRAPLHWHALQLRAMQYTFSSSPSRTPCIDLDKVTLEGSASRIADPKRWFSALAGRGRRPHKRRSHQRRALPQSVAAGPSVIEHTESANAEHYLSKAPAFAACFAQSVAQPSPEGRRARHPHVPSFLLQRTS